MYSKIFAFITLLSFQILTLNAQFISCNGGTTEISSIAQWPSTTRIGNGSSGAIEICIITNSLANKCSGNTEYLIVTDDALNIEALFDQNSGPQCFTVRTCDGFARVASNCSNHIAGDLTFIWRTVDQGNNTCTGSPIAPQPIVDCGGATVVCSGGTYPGNAQGPGTQELTCSGEDSGNQGCITFGENNTAWYKFTVNTAGNLTVDISPGGNKDDYDFALWGPGANCGSLGSPLRCSWYLPPVNGNSTGMMAGETDTSEDELGGGSTLGMVSDINVLPGEVYYLMVDGFIGAKDPTFDITFGGTATLDCGILPVVLEDFSGNWRHGIPVLSWKTSAELNNDHFELERMNASGIYETISSFQGKENSMGSSNYQYMDGNAGSENFYRLKQVDMDGKLHFSPVVEVSGNKGTPTRIAAYYPNPVKDGLTISMQTDGSEITFLSVTNLMGKEVKSLSKAEINLNGHLLELNLAHFKPGIYFVKLIFQSGDSESIKVIVE